MKNEQDLRFGYIAELYFDAIGKKKGKQLDLLDEWFHGLIVTEDPSDGNTKRDVSFDENELMIHAVRYHGRLYGAGDSKTSQIVGRLMGTAKSNQEKEKKNADMIRRKLSDRLCSQEALLSELKGHVSERVNELSDEELYVFAQLVFDLIVAAAQKREKMSSRERIEEYVSMHDDVFDQLIYNAMYQWNLETRENLAAGYLWLLLGGLLRDECMRLVYFYDSSMIALRRQPSENGTLLDKLHYLLAPEDYEAVYDGDDLDREYPGIEWHCDDCGAHLNEQEGFDDHQKEWICTKCGHANPLGWEYVFENKENEENGISADQKKSLKALEERRKKK